MILGREFKVIDMNISKIVPRYGDKGGLIIGDGSLFICPNPNIGRLSFAHKLFRPITDDDLITFIEISSPANSKQLQELLVENDGCSLFFGAFRLYSVKKNIHRSLKMEDQTSVSFIDENEKFRVLNPSAWASGRRVFGAIVTDRVFEIILKVDGSVEISLDGECVSVFEDVFSATSSIISSLSDKFDCNGVIDDTFFGVNGAICKKLSTKH